MNRDTPQKNNETARRRETLGADGPPFAGMSGPVAAYDLVKHPALQTVLTPNPHETRSLQVKELIDQAILDLTTRLPDFIAPGVSLRNRIGDGEKSVIHLPGFREKDVLLWEEIEPFRALDAAELSEVAARIENRCGIACDSAGALVILVERMKTLLRESMMSAIEAEHARSVAGEIEQRRSGLLHSVKRLLPSIRAREDELKAEADHSQQRSREHAELHEGNYKRCPMRAGVSLMLGRMDSLWYFRPEPVVESSAATDRDDRAGFNVQRINTFSIALASLGIFQKGERGWDQNYPTSPLRFWSEHIDPYLDPRPTSADGRSRSA